MFGTLSSSASLDANTYHIVLFCFSQVKPESLSKIMVELNAKKHMKDYIKREHDLERNRLLPTFSSAESNPGMYSPFNDKLRYAGVVPTGAFLIPALKSRGAIVPHMV